MSKIALLAHYCDRRAVEFRVMARDARWAHDHVRAAECDDIAAELEARAEYAMPRPVHFVPIRDANTGVA